jgi:hypothetical protein
MQKGDGSGVRLLWRLAAMCILPARPSHEYHGRSFCPICGSRFSYLNEEGAEIMLGSLDDGPGDLSPQREGWIIRRETWLEPVASAGQFDRDPE